MNELLVLDEAIINKIYLVRGQKVMVDKDLALLYSVTISAFNQAVKRHARRFPDDFMFRLSAEEWELIARSRSQNVILKRGQNTKYLPYVFTEQGIAMLSSILNSDTAIEVNIRIIRIFTRLREMLLTHKDILIKLEQLERQVVQNSEEIKTIFSVLKELINPPSLPREPIGFKTGHSS